MAFFPIFLSVVIVVKNQAESLNELLRETANGIESMVSDYELIVVDNGSEDESISMLKALTNETGQPNVQVYALTKEVDTDAASWVGLENALGDFVTVIDPLNDDINFLSQMLEQAVCGADVVFASNKQKAIQGLAYSLAFGTFNAIYKRLNGVHLAKEAPHYRVLSKRIVNFILQHAQPALTYRHLPATGGFSRAILNYSWTPKKVKSKSLVESIDRGMRLMISTTRAPMRIATTLSLFGALANLVYSIYVLVVALTMPHVAPGWVSLSLQQSGMFFLISIVLLVLGEYIITLTSLSNGGPLYHVAQEFTSARMTRREKLNIEDAQARSRSPQTFQKNAIR